MPTESSITPDILNTEMRSIDLGPVERRCFKLINEKEELQVGGSILIAEGKLGLIYPVALYVYGIDESWF